MRCVRTSDSIHHFSNDQNHIGGILVAMLEPAGGFGKFVSVLLALSVVGNIVRGQSLVGLPGTDTLMNRPRHSTR